MAALALNPTIRRQVMSAAREVLAQDAAAPAVDALVAAGLEGLTP